MTVELRLLSRVACRGRDVTSPRLRGLLALLAGEPRTGVSVVRLVEGLWPDDRPEKPAKALQVAVSRARSQLGADVIASTPTGYRLGLDESAVDASAVVLSASASSRCSRDGDHAGALAHAEEGLALWEGSPPSERDAGDDPVSVLRAERVPTYWTLMRARALALARLGRHAEGFDALTGVVREYPRDEEVLAGLLRCEAATAGPSAALARYETYRRSLRDELGTDPGTPLQELHRELLQDEAPAVRRGVAHEPNPLLGRGGDLAAVLGLLRTSRVTSIVGTGGLGKTRLANTVAREAPQRAVHFVALAGVARDEDVAGEVASVLGVGESPRGRLGGPADLVSAIADVLGPGPVLLALDNCEHVIDGAAGLAGALVSLTRDLRVLTTSRAPLGLSSESVYPLPALDLPTAVELFRQRAHAARPGVDLPDGAVEELCRHLDGLPLAIELAAARVRVMSVSEIARGLDDRFALLRGNARDAPSRHRTMHAVVDWSWNLLSPSGRAAMRALSIFPAGFTTDAARHLLSGGEVLEVLEDLVDQSLLEVVEGVPGTRFRMLESVREFSASHREAEGETERAVAGLLAWAREFGAMHHGPLFGAEPFDFVERVRVEQDNLLHVHRHGLARQDGAAVAAVAAVLGGMWTLESAYSRLIVLLEESAGLLSRFRPGPEDVEVTRTALALSVLMTSMLKGPRATRALVALRRLPAPPPTDPVRAMALMMASLPEILGPDSPALTAMCESDAPALAAVANFGAGYMHERNGDLERAVASTERMLAGAGTSPAPWLLLLAHSRLSELLAQLDQGERALHHLHTSLELMERHRWPDTFGLMWALAAAHISLGQCDEAEQWLDRSLLQGQGPDDEYGTATFNLGARAEIAIARGDVDTGLRLWREAVDRLSREPSPMAASDLDPYALEAHCVAVVAHAGHGRPDLVEDIVAGLPAKLAVLLSDRQEPLPSFFMDLPVCGGLLLALAMAELARPDVGPDGLAWAARAIALAERLHHIRAFQPTMSSAAARRAAEDADGPAYADAVSEYAGLGRGGLRDAARRLMEARVSGAPSG
ncbi:BTAD domain-containing putative transcriptional regulator [Actinomadura sp. B10D3]|uniref:ATP-binding protein n=1 Tax=Actinomadura sp. B10D3 TaxID=3153557 RepID=UPI00325ECC1B